MLINPIVRNYKPLPPKMKQSIFERDNYTCQNCGKKGVPGQAWYNLQIHHKIPYRAGGEHTPDNLIVLCSDCHKLLDNDWVQISKIWTRYMKGEKTAIYSLMGIEECYPNLPDEIKKGLKELEDRENNKFLCLDFSI